VLGSVMTSTYGPQVASALSHSGVNVAPADAKSAKDGLGFALQLAGTRRGLGASFVADAQSAFVVGMHHAVIVGALAAFIGALIVIKWLPARAADAEVFEEQDEEAAVLGDVDEGAAGDIGRNPAPVPAFVAER
jgi:hypothetical protein